MARSRITHSRIDYVGRRSVTGAFPSLRRLRRRDRVAVLVFLLPATLAAASLVTRHGPVAVLALIPAIFGLWGIVVSGVLLRIGYIGTGFSDPVVVSEAARMRVLSGASPYGVGYPETTPPGWPFPYGPLALLDSVPLELAASIALLALLAWKGRPMTLALYSGLPFSIYLASAGNNDFIPALLLASGLLALPRAWGGVLIGLSVAWKPYTLVFVPVALANGSLAAFVAAVAVTIGGWLPLLWWGGYPETVAMLNTLQGSSALRFLAAPASLAAFRWGVPAACVAFVLLTMSSSVWSLGYLIPLGVALGIWLEPTYAPLPAARP